MNRCIPIAALCLTGFALAPVGSLITADEPPLAGYSAEASRAERQWEEKFRATPDADKLRAYMEHLTARPHHVGSPYDKANAAWILAKYKEFGLDAHIETFNVLFPTPPLPVTAITRG